MKFEPNIAEWCSSWSDYLNYNLIKVYWFCVVALYTVNYIRDCILQETEPWIVKFLARSSVGNWAGSIE